MTIAERTKKIMVLSAILQNFYKDWTLLRLNFNYENFRQFSKNILRLKFEQQKLKAKSQ